MDNNLQNDKKPRIEYIDLAKGICIFLVVSFHVTGTMKVEMPLNNYLLLFRMPLYYFLSGCFFKPYNGFVDFIKRKTNKLLVPFFFSYLFFSFLIPNVLFHGLGIDLGTLSLRRLPFAWYEVKYPFIAIWFLLCLFEMNILFYITYWVADKTKYKVLMLVVGSLIMAGIACLLKLYGIKLPGMLNKAFQAQPFFLAGYLTLRKSSILQPNKTDKYLPLLFCACFGLLVLFEYSYAWFGLLSVYACGIVGALGVILLAKYLKWLPSFSYFGRYSIMILISHGLVLTLFLKLFSYLNFSTVFLFGATLMCTWLSYYLIIPFMRRFLPHVTAQKDIIKVY